ncbi:transcriptional regulator [Rhodoferax sp.]|uniref:transcriptional regulator n=1 Tax=Rhodoferax sp. TaxID=50421 RepID=UPI00276B3DD5|nr:transcriptional regulator [Rhodoferax sp.]
MDEPTSWSRRKNDRAEADPRSRSPEYALEHPEAGDVVQGSGGVRKVRWARAGTGKSGGVRVCYYTRNAAGQILLLVIYAKSVRASIPGAVLKQIEEVLDHDD